MLAYFIFCFFLKPLILHSGNWSVFRDFQGLSWNTYSSIALHFKACKPVLLWLTQVTKSQITQVFLTCFLAISLAIMYFTQWGVSLFEGVAKFVLCRKTLALHAGVTWSPFLKFLFIHWQVFGGFSKRFYPPPMVQIRYCVYQSCLKLKAFFT